MKKKTKPLRTTPSIAPHHEAPAEAFRLDEEATSFAEELIEEVTSAEFVGEDARNEAFAEETAPLYDVDFTALDDEDSAVL